MILVDTSVWADHFGRRNAAIADLIEHDELLGHPFVTAELALGSLADWTSTVALLASLPQARVARQPELMVLIERQRLSGSGIGFVDAHLLASAMLSGALLWSRDKRLTVQAQRLGCAWTPPV